MSNEFNKANPASSGEGKAPAQTVASTRLTAEEAEQEFMHYVERKYPDELVYIFSNIRELSRSGATTMVLWLSESSSPTYQRFRLPGGSINTMSEKWYRLSCYLQNMGYEATSGTKRPSNSAINVTINWSGPRRLHP